MTTCLDLATCQETDRLYNIVCNFSYNYKNYICNSQATCTRTDGTYDCCASNIIDCITSTTLRIPTTQPTTTNTVILCNQLCNAEYRIDKCYWYEKINLNTLCNDNTDKYCCSPHREECCITNNKDIYIIIGCVTIILILFALYRYIISYHIKIVPAKNVTGVETPDKYIIVFTA